MKRAVLVVALGVVCAASIGYAVNDRPAPVATASATAPSLAAFSWPKGAIYTYDFSWTAKSTGEVEGKAAAGDFDLAGRLVLTSLGSNDGVTTLAARITPAERHLVKAFGSEIMGDDATMRATFDERETLMEVDSRGVVRSIRVPSDAPPLYKTLAHGVLTATQVTLPKDPAATWTATEFGPSGHALMRYAVDANDASKLLRAVESVDFAASKGKRGRDLAVRGTIVLDAAGCVASLEQSEASATAQGPEATRVVAQSHFEMHLSGRAKDPTLLTTRDLSKYESHPPGDVPGKVTDKERDDRLSKGMRIDEAKITIGTYDGSKPPQGWITRASAMLRAHPEYDAEVAAAFATASAEGRSLAMDMLAAAGDARAQATMRELLDRADVRSHPDQFVNLVQRFTFVRDPEPASLDYVLAAYDAATKRNDTSSARGAAFAIGALVGRLAISSPSPLTERAHARLVADLKVAKDVDAKNALVAALGNTGLPESFAPMMALANDDRGSTRAQVALSLRKIAGQRAIDATFTLLRDEDTQVASAALRSLGQRGFDAALLDRMATQVMAGEVKSAVDASIVALVASAERLSPTLERLLEFLIERDAADDPELAAKARGVLARTPRG